MGGCGEWVWLAMMVGGRVSVRGYGCVLGAVKGEPRAVCKLGVVDGALVER